MNAAEWDTAVNPHWLLALLGPKRSPRKLRHWVCSCLRKVMPATLVSIEAITLAFAEQLADKADVDSHEWTALRDELHARARLLSAGPFDAGRLLVLAVGQEIREDAHRLVAAFDDAGISVTIPLALLREIFGNPFRPVAFGPWRTDTATALARGMYESRDFAAMPILADALQDAGCDSPDVLNHCRDPHATHVRGCWVVDGVLGKE